MHRRLAAMHVFLRKPRRRDSDHMSLIIEATLLVIADFEMYVWQCALENI
jgi:hypothetical protein